MAPCADICVCFRFGAGMFTSRPWWCCRHSGSSPPSTRYSRPQTRAQGQILSFSAPERGMASTGDPHAPPYSPASVPDHRPDVHRMYDDAADIAPRAHSPGRGESAGTREQRDTGGERGALRRPVSQVSARPGRQSDRPQAGPWRSGRSHLCAPRERRSGWRGFEQYQSPGDSSGNPKPGRRSRCP